MRDTIGEVEVDETNSPMKIPSSSSLMYAGVSIHEFLVGSSVLCRLTKALANIIPAAYLTKYEAILSCVLNRIIWQESFKSSSLPSRVQLTL